MALGSNNPFPSALFVEGTTPTSPSAGNQRLFVRSSDHVLCRVNSSGTVTPVEAVMSGAAAYNSTTQNVTNGSQDVITLDSELWDTDTYHSTSSNTGRLTVPTTAYYRVTARVYVNAGGTNNTAFYLTLFKNGEGATTVYGGQAIGANLNSDGGQISLTLTISLTAADYLEMKVYNTTGSTRAVGHASNNSQRSYFEIVRQ